MRQLSQEQIQQYWRDGYLSFPDVLTTDEIEQAKTALSELVQRVANSTEVDKRGSFWIMPGTEFGVQFEPGYSPQDASDGDVELKVRKLMWYCDQHPHLSYLSAHHPRICGVIESLLGAGPLMFQDMALIKPPFIGSEKPWHQDDAYFSVVPLDAVCGVWIALDEATVENGCMHVLPGGHKVGPRKHFHGRDCEIVEDRLNPALAVPVELPPGGAMFFHGLLPHQTPPNSSSARRRALQFHYRAATSQIVPKEQYDSIFIEADGTPASCAAARL
ncbi:MAG: phytanoyl-CoA dioxygenase family protein [Abitibacteriaceae bacterium]|nr:phytanoyl-CoA dioxygenase family protein [Abditibacteriaceae bacterium]